MASRLLLVFAPIHLMFAVVSAGADVIERGLRAPRHYADEFNVLIKLKCGEGVKIAFRGKRTWR